MAEPKHRKLVSIDTPWQDCKDTYKGETKTYREAMCKMDDNGKVGPIVIRVANDRIAGELKVGETYAGLVFKPEGSDKWRFSIRASDNASLQKEGGAYGGKGAAPGHQGGHGGTGGGYQSNAAGQRVGMCVKAGVDVAIAEMGNDQDATEIDLARVEAVALALHALALKLEGMASQASTAAGGQAGGGMNEAMKVELMKAINEALKQAKLEERWATSNITEDQAIEVWTKCSANPMQFCIAISQMLADEPELPGPDAAGENLPF